MDGDCIWQGPGGQGKEPEDPPRRQVTQSQDVRGRGALTQQPGQGSKKCSQTPEPCVCVGGGVGRPTESRVLSPAGCVSRFSQSSVPSVRVHLK